MPEISKPSFSLKDQLFNRDRVIWLGKLIADANPDFDQRGFVRHAMQGFAPLELKQRISKIAAGLEKFLDRRFDIAASQILRALPPPLNPDRTDDDFGDFIFCPLGEFIVRQGLSEEHLELSLNLLCELTQRFSMEYAIRHFINAFPDQTLAVLKKWAVHRHYHVRRLVSEGTRPLLPWAGRISFVPGAAMPLLDHLFADRARFVTRSVANHLNDISKTDPHLVLTTLSRWQKSGLQKPGEMAWMTQHALRTLSKKGDSQAMIHRGFDPDPQIAVRRFSIRKPSLRIGETVDFSFTVVAKKAENLLIDYVIDFPKLKNRRSHRVFRISRLRVEKGQQVLLEKKHPLRPATTFTLYPGRYRLTLQINGRAFGTRTFDLVGDDD